MGPSTLLMTSSTVLPTVTNRNILTTRDPRTVSQTPSWRTSTSTLSSTTSSTLPVTTTTTTSTTTSTTSTSTLTTSTTTMLRTTTRTTTTTKLTTVNPSFARAFQPPIETIHTYDYDSSNQERIFLTRPELLRTSTS